MRRRGFVLVVVVFFVVLLFSGVATFLRRSTLDAAIVRNRDFAARAEALARGGVRLGVVLLQQDKLEEATQRGLPGETTMDLWALAEQLELQTDDGGSLRIAIEDASARINLNALLVTKEESDTGERIPDYLKLVLEKVVEEMPQRVGQKPYDPEELAANLIDYVDEDEVTQRGEPEDAWYQEQDPPYGTSKAGALLSVDELALVRGFDPPLVDALRPYVTVFPLSGGSVNPNTAPPWVLAALSTNPNTPELLSEDQVKRVVKTRAEHPICKDTVKGCGPLDDLLQTFPELSGFQSTVFRIEATATYGDVQRIVEATVSRKKPDQPEFLAWRVR
jgi:general secretion pathway protein K